MLPGLGQIWERIVKRAQANPDNVWNWYEVKKTGLPLDLAITLSPHNEQIIRKGYGLDA